MTGHGIDVPRPEFWSWETFCKWLVMLLALRVFGADLLRLGM